MCTCLRLFVFFPRTPYLGEVSVPREVDAAEVQREAGVYVHVDVRGGGGAAAAVVQVVLPAWREEAEGAVRIQLSILNSVTRAGTVQRSNIDMALQTHYATAEWPVICKAEPGAAVWPGVGMGPVACECK